MSTIAYWDGFGHIPLNRVNLWNGSQFTSPNGLYIWDGTKYTKVWPQGFPYRFPFTLGSTGAAMTPTLPPAMVGASGPHAWETATQAELETWFSEMAALGMKHVRFGANWHDIEAVRGTYWWGRVDMMVAAASAAGLEPLLVLLWYPDWAVNFEASGLTYMTDWTNFCAAVATRYAGRVGAYEIWNEPNLANFWASADVETYATFFIPAADAIRAVDAEAKVITAGLAPAGNFPGETRAPLEFLTRLYELGIAQEADGIGLHPYCFPDMPSSGAEWNLWTLLPQFKGVMATYGDTEKEIWLTEFGAPTGSERGIPESKQSASIVEAISLAADDPQLGPVYLYTLHDLDLGADNMESWFGLYRKDGEPKPVVAAVRAEIARRSLPAPTT